jgi:hypothetical protein
VCADSGVTIITKDTESKHGVKFDVTFRPSEDETVFVSVDAPQKVETLSLAGFGGVLLLDQHIDQQMLDSLVLIDEKINRKGDFIVDRPFLPKKGVVVLYGSRENQRTYILDLSTYQPKNIDGTNKLFPASESRVRHNQIEVSAGFTVLNGGDNDVLAAPRVTTVEGVNVGVELAKEHLCPNGEIVNSGFMLNVTPTLEDGYIHVKGSARMVIPVNPDPKELKNNVQWMALKELNIPFYFKTKDPIQKYRLGPIEMDGKIYEIWLSAKQMITI